MASTWVSAAFRSAFQKGLHQDRHFLSFVVALGDLTMVLGYAAQYLVFISGSLLSLFATMGRLGATF